MPNTADPENLLKPEAGQEQPEELQGRGPELRPGTAAEPSAEAAGTDRIEIKDLRAAFRKMEDAKEYLIKRVSALRRESDDNIQTMAQAELQMGRAQHETTESNKRMRTLEEEVSSLRAELNTAKTLLEEIDKTLA